MKKIIISLIILAIIASIFFYMMRSEEIEIEGAIEGMDVDFFIKGVKEDQIMRSCYATIEDDESLCEGTESEIATKNCQERAIDNLDIIVTNKLATGDSSNLPESTFADKKFCGSLNSGDCESLEGTQKQLCEIILTKDVNKCKTLQLNEEEEKACIDGGTKVLAFKEKGEQACEEISSSIIEEKTCMGLVTKDCETQATELAKDMAKAESAKVFSKKEDCEPIVHKKIKEMCMDDSKKYEDILDVVYGR